MVQGVQGLEKMLNHLYKHLLQEALLDTIKIIHPLKMMVSVRALTLRMLETIKTKKLR